MLHQCPTEITALLLLYYTLLTQSFSIIEYCLELIMKSSIFTNSLLSIILFRLLFYLTMLVAWLMISHCLIILPTIAHPIPTTTLKTKDYCQQFLPGESHGQMSLVGYSPEGHKELDMSNWAHMCGWHTQTHTRNPRHREWYNSPKATS